MSGSAHPTTSAEMWERMYRETNTKLESERENGRAFRERVNEWMSDAMNNVRARSEEAASLRARLAVWEQLRPDIAACARYAAGSLTAGSAAVRVTRTLKQTT